MLVVALVGLLAYAWWHHLYHREHMKALENSSRDQVAEVMRSIRERGRTCPRKEGAKRSSTSSAQRDNKPQGNG